MFHKIKKLELLEDYRLLCRFEDGKAKVFDMKTMMAKYPVFLDLKENDLFKKGRIDVGGFGIVWNDDLDISAQGIYELGEPYEEGEKRISDIAKALKQARLDAGLTQNDLSRLSGVTQSNIARIENGLVDPTIKTVEKLLAPLGKRLEIK